MKLKLLSFKNTILHKYLCFFLLITLISSGQNTTKITFINQNSVPLSSLTLLPAEVREAMQKQIEQLKYETIVYFDFNNVYFLSKKQDLDAEQKGKLGQSVKDSRESYEDLGSAVKHPLVKFIKNIKKQSYSELKDGKLLTSKLQTLQLQTTKNTRKILGYNCIEKVGFLNKIKISVFVTKEIPGKCSPNQLAVLDGVVLAYTQGAISGIATKISFNEPNIVDFLHNENYK